MLMRLCRGVSAAQGFVVFSVEHADGSGSAAKLAYNAGWLYYKGWGAEEARMAQTRCSLPSMWDQL